jgi:hypothetical protein
VCCASIEFCAFIFIEKGYVPLAFLYTSHSAPLYMAVHWPNMKAKFLRIDGSSGGWEMKERKKECLSGWIQ